MTRNVLEWVGIALCGAALWFIWPKAEKMTEGERVKAMINSKIHLP